jgi:ABC-type phosphate/phosphonate transport system substrate-binding protein
LTVISRSIMRFLYACGLGPFVKSDDWSPFSMRRVALVIFSWLYLSGVAMAAQTVPETTTNTAKSTERIDVGVLTTAGVTRSIEAWQPLMDLLNQAAKDMDAKFRFSLQPLTLQDLRAKIDSGEIGIFFSDPSTFVWSEVNNQARLLLSSSLMWEGKAIDATSSVIFTKSDKPFIQGIRDLKDKKLMAVELDSFEGWQLVHNEFAIRKIHPETFLASLMFTSGNEREVVYAVQTGLVDAGVVRSGVLEKLAKEGIIGPNEFRPVSPKQHNDFPFLSSTNLYPGWALAKVNNVPEQALAVIIEALLNIQPGSEQARATGDFVWRAPQNYQPVHSLLISLRAAPYVNYFRQAALRIYYNNQNLILSGLATILFSLGFLAFQLHRNLKLVEAGRLTLNSEKRSRQFYRDAVEQHTVFCMLNKGGFIEYTNKHFCQTVNRTQSELLSSNFVALFSENQKHLFESEIGELLKIGLPWNGPLDLSKADGEFAQIDCTLIPLADADHNLSEIAVVASDVTTMLDGVVTKKFHQSLELITDEVVVLAPENLEVLFCNKAAVEQFPSEELKDGWESKKYEAIVSQDQFDNFLVRC